MHGIVSESNNQQKQEVKETEIINSEENRLFLKVIMKQLDGISRHSLKGSDEIIPTTSVVGIVKKASEKAGSDFGVKTGNLVFVEPPIPCNKCSTCLIGHYSACAQNMRYDVDSADYMTVLEESRVHKLPDDIDIRLAGLLNPMGKAFYAVSEKGGTGIGKHVLILGSNLFAALCAICAKVCGASQVKLVSLTKPDKGLTDCLSKFGVVPVNHIQEEPVDILIDACGKADMFDQAVAKLNPLGKCVLVNYAKEYGIPMQMVMNHEIVITGMDEASWCFDQTLRILQCHPEIVDAIQTLSFAFESYKDAINAVEKNPYANVVLANK